MEWSHEHNRDDLPWRQTRDPYAILVSEVMLQQTQVGRCIPYFVDWLERWPRVEDLAAASPADVIRAWAGLGYNRRALMLHRAARTVTDAWEGSFPSDVATLRTLPGVGPYTAAAIASFAFEQRVSVADTNIARLVGRSLLGVASVRDSSPAAITRAAESLLPRDETRRHNLTLMDLGATVCTARTPLCGECPLTATCVWHGNGCPESKSAAKRMPKFETTARFARGRIIDRLRAAQSVPEAELAEGLPEYHAVRIRIYLEALAQEGMIEGGPEGWRLVE